MCVRVCAKGGISFSFCLSLSLCVGYEIKKIEKKLINGIIFLFFCMGKADISIPSAARFHRLHILSFIFSIVCSINILIDRDSNFAAVLHEKKKKNRN